MAEGISFALMSSFVSLSELQTPHDGAIMSTYVGTFTFKPTGENVSLV